MVNFADPIRTTSATLETTANLIDIIAGVWCGTSGGSADVQTLSPTQSIQALTHGIEVAFIAGFTNATTTPTLNVSSLGAKTIKLHDLASIPIGYIKAGMHYTARYDSSSSGQWVIIAPGSTSWQSWTPTYGGSGSLTFTAVTTTYAKYMQIGKLVFFAMDFTGTTGGVTSTDVTVSLPVAAVGSFQCGAYADVSDTALIAGTNRITSQMNIRRYDSANWGLGAGRLIHTAGFYVAS